MEGPQISENVGRARSLLMHRKFEEAASIYSDVLINATGYDSWVYGLEYAFCLLEIHITDVLEGGYKSANKEPHDSTSDNEECFNSGESPKAGKQEGEVENSIAKTDLAETPDDGAQDPEEVAPFNNLNTAWEMAEISRQGFLSVINERPEAKGKVVETYLLLMRISENTEDNCSIFCLEEVARTLEFIHGEQVDDFLCKSLLLFKAALYKFKNAEFEESLHPLRAVQGLVEEVHLDHIREHGPKKFIKLLKKLICSISNLPQEEDALKKKRAAIEKTLAKVLGSTCSRPAVESSQTLDTLLQSSPNGNAKIPDACVMEGAAAKEEVAEPDDVEKNTDANEPNTKQELCEASTSKVGAQNLRDLDRCNESDTFSLPVPSKRTEGENPFGESLLKSGPVIDLTSLLRRVPNKKGTSQSSEPKNKSSKETPQGGADEAVAGPSGINLKRALLAEEDSSADEAAAGPSSQPGPSGINLKRARVSEDDSRKNEASQNSEPKNKSNNETAQASAYEAAAGPSSQPGPSGINLKQARAGDSKTPVVYKPKNRNDVAAPKQIFEEDVDVSSAQPGPSDKNMKVATVPENDPPLPSEGAKLSRGFDIEDIYADYYPGVAKVPLGEKPIIAPNINPDDPLAIPILHQKQKRVDIVYSKFSYDDKSEKRYFILFHEMTDDEIEVVDLSSDEESVAW